LTIEHQDISRLIHHLAVGSQVSHDELKEAQNTLATLELENKKDVLEELVIFCEEANEDQINRAKDFDKENDSWHYWIAQTDSFSGSRHARTQWERFSGLTNNRLKEARMALASDDFDTAIKRLSQAKIYYEGANTQWHHYTGQIDQGAHGGAHQSLVGLGMIGTALSAPVSMFIAGSIALHSLLFTLLDECTYGEDDVELREEDPGVEQSSLVNLTRPKSNRNIEDAPYLETIRDSSPVSDTAYKPQFEEELIEEAQGVLKKYLETGEICEEVGDFSIRAELVHDGRLSTETHNYYRDIWSSRIAEFKEAARRYENPQHKVLAIRKLIIETPGISQYLSAEGRFINFLENRGFNCLGQSTTFVSAVADALGPLPYPYEFGVQPTRYPYPHAPLVVYNHETGEVWDVFYNTIQKKIRGPIYRLPMIYVAYLDEWGGDYGVPEDDLIASLLIVDSQKKDQYEVEEELDHETNNILTYTKYSKGYFPGWVPDHDYINFDSTNRERKENRIAQQNENQRRAKLRLEVPGKQGGKEITYGENGERQLESYVINEPYRDYKPGIREAVAMGALDDIDLSQLSLDSDDLFQTYTIDYNGLPFLITSEIKVVDSGEEGAISFTFVPQIYFQHQQDQEKFAALQTDDEKRYFLEGLVQSALATALEDEDLLLAQDLFRRPDDISRVEDHEDARKSLDDADKVYDLIWRAGSEITRIFHPSEDELAEMKLVIPPMEDIHADTDTIYKEYLLYTFKKRLARLRAFENANSSFSQRINQNPQAFLRFINDLDFAERETFFALMKLSNERIKKFRAHNSNDFAATSLLVEAQKSRIRDFSPEDSDDYLLISFVPVDQEPVEEEEAERKRVAGGMLTVEEKYTDSTNPSVSVVLDVETFAHLSFKYKSYHKNLNQRWNEDLLSQFATQAIYGEYDELYLDAMGDMVDEIIVESWQGFVIMRREQGFKQPHDIDDWPAKWVLDRVIKGWYRENWQKGRLPTKEEVYQAAERYETKSRAEGIKQAVDNGYVFPELCAYYRLRSHAKERQEQKEVANAGDDVTRTEG